MKAKDVPVAIVIAILLAALVVGYGIAMGRLGDHLAGMGSAISEPLRLALMLGGFIRHNAILISVSILIVMPVAIIFYKSSDGGETDA